MINSPITIVQNHAGTLQIQKVTEHKTLGLTVDYHLSWNGHVDNLPKLSSEKKCYQIAIVKHY